MKIEIEKSHVDWLEAENKRLAEKVERFEGEEYELYREKQLSKSLELSKILFEKYCYAIFKKLGFNSPRVKFDISSLRNQLSKKWFSEECRNKIQVTIGATITNNFRDAILSVGIDESVIEKVSEENSEWDLITYEENNIK